MLSYIHEKSVTPTGDRFAPLGKSCLWGDETIQHEDDKRQVYYDVKTLHITNNKYFISQNRGPFEHTQTNIHIKTCVCRYYKHLWYNKMHWFKVQVIHVWHEQDYINHILKTFQ